MDCILKVPKPEGWPASMSEACCCTCARRLPAFMPASRPGPSEQSEDQAMGHVCVKPGRVTLFWPEHGICEQWRRRE